MNGQLEFVTLQRRRSVLIYDDDGMTPDRYPCIQPTGMQLCSMLSQRRVSIDHGLLLRPLAP